MVVVLVRLDGFLDLVAHAVLEVFAAVGVDEGWRHGGNCQRKGKIHGDL
jgi:hypothetical protein